MNDNRFVENIKAYAFLFPFLLVFVVFLGYPIVYSMVLSVHEVPAYSDWYNVIGDMEYVGGKHYFNLLQDKEFAWTLILTVYYGVLTIPTTIALSLFLAILLQKSFLGRTFFRSAYFLPNVLDLLVIGVIWILLYRPETGLLNILFHEIGLLPEKFEFLTNPYSCLPSIAVAMVFKGAGFGMILFLTAINNIPKSTYEAAEIDGANEWHKLWYITLPLVRPIVLFMTITGTIACLTAFTEVYAMTTNSGGPPVTFFGETFKAANLSGYYLYRGFIDGFYGKAAAVSFVLLAIALVISFANMRILKKQD